MRLLYPASAWLSLLLAGQVGALVHEQVAFDSSDVCWWGFVPPDLVCPVLSQQNLTEMVHNLMRPYEWDGGDTCVGIYCLYSNRGFAGGRGIAVITTTDNIGRVKHVGDLLQDFEVSFSSDGDDLPFRVGDTQGEEEGMVASHQLARGDPIMAYTPVLLVHRAFQLDFAQDAKDAQDARDAQDIQQGLLQLAVDSLPRHTAELITGQLAHGPGPRGLASILTTNAFQVDLGGDDGLHYGAFPESARMNHHCRPNAVFYVDPSTLMHVTTAVRPIARGEELSISQLDPFAPLADRQGRAQLAWGHGCQCSQCDLSAGEATESDIRLREIRWIEDQLRDFDAAEDISVGLITYLLKLYEAERLECCFAGAYILASFNLNSLGYDERAVKYAGLAIEALKIEKGEGALDIKVMEELIRDPRRHYTFARRVET